MDIGPELFVLAWVNCQCGMDKTSIRYIGRFGTMIPIHR